MRKIFLYILSIISIIIIPVAITASILLTLAVNENFYISVIESLNLVETFIETKNVQIEKDIKKEIEKKTGMSQFKPRYESLRKDYEDKLIAYTSINKNEEFDKIEKQIDELDDLKWEKSSDEFKDEDDFDRFKKLKMTDLKNALKDIKEYRSKNDDQIDKIENAMEDAKDKFDDADDELKDKEEDAKDIIELRRGDFMNEMYSDISKVEPALTEELNRLFIEKELKSVIKNYLNFMTTWQRQKESGNIYESRLNVESGMIENVKKISIPPLAISLKVKVNENGIENEKNLLSEVFVEKIRETPGLKSPWVLTRIFKLSDSWIAETAGNTILKGTGLTMADGLIKSDAIILSGEKAENFEKIMMVFSAAKYTPAAAGGAVLLFVILLIIAAPDKKSGMKVSGFVLKYPSVIIVIAGIAIIIASLKPGLMIPQIINDPVNSAFFDKVAFTTALHLFAPITGVFFVLSLAGGILLKFGKKKKEPA
ncbi:MAG TPA: hypothetical protein PKG60_08730 [Spirochaetota bacterium]|nr:hypothetical protein [Spirochaetota bacterium]HPS87361.1 hypothetical protein [Spirochaetota bacterium]